MGLFPLFCSWFSFFSMKSILSLFKFQFSTLNFDRFNLVYIYHKKRYIVGLGLCGFDMVAGVGVVVVIVWGGGCCGGDCVGDGCCEKK